MQSLSDFFGHHGAAVVGHQGPGQSPFLESLAQTMDQGLGRLIEIPLGMAHQPRAVIEYAQQQGRDPFPCTGQHASRAVVEIKVPQYALQGILWRMRSSGLCGVCRELLT